MKRAITKVEIYVNKKINYLEIKLTNSYDRKKIKMRNCKKKYYKGRIAIAYTALAMQVQSQKHVNNVRFDTDSASVGIDNR